MDAEQKKIVDQFIIESNTNILNYFESSLIIIKNSLKSYINDQANILSSKINESFSKVEIKKEEIKKDK